MRIWHRLHGLRAPLHDAALGAAAAVAAAARPFAAAAQPFAAVTCTAKAATKNSILLRCAEIDLLLL